LACLPACALKYQMRCGEPFSCQAGPDDIAPSLGLSSLTSVHRFGDRCQAGNMVHAVSGAVASMSLVHIFWANWQHRRAS